MTPETDCQICARRRQGGTEIYEVRGDAGISVFDLAQAKKMALDGRPALPITPELLQAIAKHSRYEEKHLPHVDIGTPGILGEYLGDAVPMDGIHRAVRCLQEKREFFVYVLTEEETLSCLISQDLWESSAGLLARRFRELLHEVPEGRRLEVELKCKPETVQMIRRLLTSEENRRISIRVVPSPKKL